MRERANCRRVRRRARLPWRQSAGFLPPRSPRARAAGSRPRLNLLSSIPGFRDVRRRPSSPPSQLLCARGLHKKTSRRFFFLLSTRRRPCVQVSCPFSRIAVYGAKSPVAAGPRLGCYILAIRRLAESAAFGTGYRHKTASGKHRALLPSRPVVVSRVLIPACEA